MTSCLKCLHSCLRSVAVCVCVCCINSWSCNSPARGMHNAIDIFLNVARQTERERARQPERERERQSDRTPHERRKLHVKLQVNLLNETFYGMANGRNGMQLEMGQARTRRIVSRPVAILFYSSRRLLISFSFVHISHLFLSLSLTLSFSLSPSLLHQVSPYRFIFLKPRFYPFLCSFCYDKLDKDIDSLHLVAFRVRLRLRFALRLRLRLRLASPRCHAWPTSLLTINSVAYARHFDMSGEGKNLISYIRCLQATKWRDARLRLSPILLPTQFHNDRNSTNRRTRYGKGVRVFG